MGSYKITKGDQSINVNVEGLFTPSDAQAYVNDFNKAVANINSADYHLCLDSTKLAVSTAEMQQLLKGCLELYKALGFKKVSVKIGDNVILKMQINRLAKEVGLENVEIN